jgi:leucyl/phenylalanyl-tRNA--protein transferase
MSQIYLDRLGPEADAPFPPTANALLHPNGLLAWGGGLEPERLLRAYSAGLFPWYSEGEPILWWTPNPRCVLFPDQVYRSQRTRRRFNGGHFRVTADSAFQQVIEACAQPRNGIPGTWINADLQKAFVALHRLGHAHSVEVWRNEHLVGGVYGMAIGRIFFAESMFSRETDTSKIALIALCEHLISWSFGLLDCQVSNPHLLSMGATEIPRVEFEAQLQKLTVQPSPVGSWHSGFIAAQRW